MMGAVAMRERGAYNGDMEYDMPLTIVYEPGELRFKSGDVSLQLFAALACDASCYADYRERLDNGDCEE